jgi:hypothetical protein
MARHKRVASFLCVAVGLIAFAGAGILAAAPVGASGSPNLYVGIGGSDTTTCRLSTQPCATVDYALTQAPSGATINVGAGTFKQNFQVTGGQTVNITGTVQNGANVTIFKPTSTVSDTDPNNFEGLTNDAVLADVNDGATANISNMIINGIKLVPSFTTCGNPNFVGLYYHNAQGTVTNVSVTNVQLAPAAFGCQGGDAVYTTSDSTFSSVNFNLVSVSKYDKNGIVCRGVETACMVTGSTVTGIGPSSLVAQNGIEIAFGARATLQSNTITGNSYTGAGASAAGILLFDSSTSTVAGNTLSANDVDIAGATGDFGVNAQPTAGAWNISNNTAGSAVDNIAAGSGGPVEGNGYGDGIQLASVSNLENATTVSGNTDDSNYEYGISLFGTTGITVTGNHTDAGYDGIFVDSASTGNTFTGNVSKHATNYDFQDTSTGSSDVGTANKWLPATTHGSANVCRPLLDSSPEGLC